MTGAATGNAADIANRFVLVVDSEPQNLIFTSMITQRMGYRVCSALSVGSALEIVNVSMPLLVVSELRLTGLDALDLLELLRQKPGTSMVPFVIMTKGWTPEVELRCREDGNVACLKKPLQVIEFYRTIHQLIEPGSRRRDLRIEIRPAVMVNGRPLDRSIGECATNLSVSGLCIKTRSRHDPDTKVMIRLVLNEEEIDAEARIAYCRPLEDGSPGMWGVGLQFVKTPTGAEEIIRDFIHGVVTHGMDAAE